MLFERFRLVHKETKDQWFYWQGRDKMGIAEDERGNGYLASAFGNCRFVFLRKTLIHPLRKLRNIPLARRCRKPSGEVVPLWRMLKAHKKRLRLRTGLRLGLSLDLDLDQIQPRLWRSQNSNNQGRKGGKNGR